MLQIARLTGGCGVKQVASKARGVLENDMIPIVDYAIEGREADKKRILEVYENVGKELPGTPLAVRASPFLTRDGVFDGPRFRKMLDAATGPVFIEAEDYDTEVASRSHVNRLMRIFNSGKHTAALYKTYQMYRKDGFARLMSDLDRAAGEPWGVKLVRGAYLRVDRGKNILHGSASDTHRAYDLAAETLLGERYKDVVFGTYNKQSLALILAQSNDRPKIAHLLGVNEQSSLQVQRDGGLVYKHIPFGPFLHTIPYVTRTFMNLSSSSSDLK